MWFWLSFVDPRRASDQQHLGVAIVEVTADDPVPAMGLTPEQLAGKPEKARAFLAAVLKARKLGIHPGGEVKGIEVNPPEEPFRNRLLTKEQVLASGLGVEDASPPTGECAV